VESRGEASQIGEAGNESHGEALIHFIESSKGEWTNEIFGGDFMKFRESLDLPEVRGSYNRSAERIQSSGGAAPLIQVGQGCWIIHEISYRDLMRKVSKVR
jgi:hypothetical protein